MIENERIRQAIETLDHLLWEALIRLLNREFGNEIVMCVSKAYQCQDNGCRVVYEYAYRDYIRLETDVNIASPEMGHVLGTIQGMIDSNMIIAKVSKQTPFRWHKARELCSSYSYVLFLFEALLPIERLNILMYDQTEHSSDYANSEFVRFIAQDGSGDIVCPCIGKHLANTADLNQFSYEFTPTKKVGKNKFEFRFTVDER